MTKDSTDLLGENVKACKRKGIIYKIAKAPFIHKFVDKLRIYRLLNWLLEGRPVIKLLPNTGTIIRMNSVAAFALAEEMFSGSGYKDAISNLKINTFVDLGCNVGWFPCFLSEEFATKNIVGLLIDADPVVLESSKWHIKKNNFQFCDVLHGAVGCAPDEIEKTFHINPSNTQSSLKPFSGNHPFPVKGKIKEMVVPALSVENEWAKRHGNLIIDLLKIDIEGAELDFLKSEIVFISKKVKRIVCEWHNWHVSYSDIDLILKANGFICLNISESDENGGVAIFSNTKFE